MAGWTSAKLRERGSCGVRIEAEEGGRGPQPGQRCTAVADRKKRLGLAEVKASVEHLRKQYAFTERRACRLMKIAVSSFRYRSGCSDDGLREQLQQLARERPRF